MNKHLQEKSIKYWKIFLLIVLIILTVNLYFINYNIGVQYCNLMKVSPDLQISMVGAGLANDFTIIAFLVEGTVFYKVLEKLQRFSFFRQVSDYLMYILD